MNIARMHPDFGFEQAQVNVPADWIGKKGWKAFVTEPLTASQKHGDPVETDVWTIPAVAKTAGELSEETQKYTKQLDQACRAHIDQRAHWTAGPKLFDNAKANKPISKKYADWVDACWDHFEAQMNLLLAGTPWDESMLNFPAGPVESVLIARKE